MTSANTSANHPASLNLRRFLAWALMIPAVSMATAALGADLAGSKDPPGMKRYEGSEIIGYRAPKFDEAVFPLGPPTQISPPVYEKSQKVEGQLSRYTYAAPMGRSTAEVFRNYKLEFQRLGVQTLYEKGTSDHGWFGPTLSTVAEEDKLMQILEYNEADERVLVGKTKDAQPTYYYVFVTAYKDGVIPERLQKVVQPGRAFAELIVVAPEQMEEKMAFVSASDMSKALAATGKVALYGVYFDTDKDTLRSDSDPTLKEIGKLFASQPNLKVHVVGHTDNQGTGEHNLDLSRRRAATVVKELTAKYGVAANRLDSFGAGWYAPVAANTAEEGRAKNRRVELVQW